MRGRKKNNLLIFISVFTAVLLIGAMGLLYIVYNSQPKAPESDKTKKQAVTDQEDGRKELLTALSKGDTKKDPDKKDAPDNKDLSAADNGVLDPDNKASGDAVETDSGNDGGEGARTEGKYKKLLEDPDYVKAHGLREITPFSEDETVIDFTGDILFDPSYAIMSQMISRGGQLEKGFSQNIIDELKSADITFVNNEFPYSDRGAPLPDKTYTFRAKPSSVSYLTQLGVDAVSIANNHAYDYGETALLDTIDILDKEGIGHIGAGNNIDEAAREICFISNDTKIAVIAATQIERIDNPDTKGATESSPGVFRCWNVKRLASRVRELSEENDVVIVFIHWGTESTTELDWAQRDQAKILTEAGADVIVGAHPHVLQAFEYVNGIPVAYSLGNFLFNSKTLDTCIMQIRIPRGGDGVRVRVLPALQNNCKVTLLDGEERIRVLDYLNSLSSTSKLDENGYMGKR